MPRPISYIGSRLPRGWSDLLLQLALFFSVYQGYQVVRGLSEGKSALAFANAERIIDVERSLGLFFEPGLQTAMLDFSWLIDGANWMYVNSHFIITTSFLAWLYLFRNEHFYFVRNMFMVAMLLALTGYLLFPTAPPRLIARRGLHRHDRHLHRASTPTPTRSACWSTSTPRCRACTSASRR